MPTENPVDVRGVEALRDESFRLFGADIAFNMLGLPQDGKLADADPDYLLVLTRIMHILTKLCGDKHAAARWMFDSPVYRAIAENDPYYCLEQGSFWAMCVMEEWLRVVEKFGSPQFREDLFTRSR